MKVDNQTYIFDARGVAKRFRHAAIFGALESLSRGETMRFVNDHDPLPLLQQLQTRYGNQVEIQYIEREPGAITIDFVVRPQHRTEEVAQTSSGGCGGGGGCGCSGG
ncbi:DUF2249 domain-containing protein [Burkholderiaceae bacterium DAT-1]|nr:DUF2249 domain-containing protein [Burkholderiaceae bacterium DAT-1]